MASRIIHLAIAEGIAKEISLKDRNRFHIGVILPDAYSAGINTAVSHLKTRILDGTKITYQLSYFRQYYHTELLHDELYLGYYMHLIQDILFRHFVYDEYHWDPVPKGNVDRLHNDYHLLNTLMIKRYGLTNDLYLPERIENEKLFELYPFDLQFLMDGLRNDFVPYQEGTTFFFTDNMAEEFIERATKQCLLEIEALRKGSNIIDEDDYAWKAHS